MLQDVYETCCELLTGATMPKALACHGSVVLPCFSCPCYRVGGYTRRALTLQRYLFSRQASRMELIDLNLHRGD